jgi:hypothetical protein
MNRRRGGGDVDVEERYLERGVWERMTDRENKRFRYVYCCRWDNSEGVRRPVSICHATIVGVIIISLSKRYN